jgi:hypothetical protein
MLVLFMRKSRAMCRFLHGWHGGGVWCPGLRMCFAAKARIFSGLKRILRLSCGPISGMRRSSQIYFGIDLRARQEIIPPR